MNRDPRRILSFMAGLAPVGRERSLNRRPARDDLAVLDDRSRFEIEMTSVPPPMLSDQTVAHLRTADASVARYMAEQKQLHGLETPTDLGRLEDLDTLHRDEHLLRLSWMFVVGKGSDGRSVWLPLVSAPVTVNKGFFNSQVTLTEDFSLLSGLLEPADHEDLEERFFHSILPELKSGGTIDGIHNARSGILGNWASAVVEAIGCGTPNEVTTDSRRVLRSSELTVVLAMAVHTSRDPDAPNIGATLRQWRRLYLDGTALRALYDPGAIQDHPAAWVSSSMPLNRQQAQLVSRARESPVTVISGPPGTGKTHVAAAIANDLVTEGQSVLIAAHSAHAIDALEEMLRRHPSHVHTRFGDKAHRRNVAELLGGGGLETHTDDSYHSGRRTLASARSEVSKARDYLLRLIRAEAAFERRLGGPHSDLDFSDRVINQSEQCLAILQSNEFIFPVIRHWIARRRLYNLIGPTQSLDEAMSIVHRMRAEADVQAIVESGGARLATRFTTLEQAEIAERRVMAAFMSLMRPMSRAARRAATDLATALRAGRTTRRLILRELAGDALTEAVPLWLGTLADIDDMLPMQPGMFDVVIFDEASQINQVRAASALARAKRCVIVGDPRQLRHVSFVSDDQVTAALHKADLDVNDIALNVRRNSLFDVAAAAARVTMLDEHYRCLPHLIEFSNQEFYRSRLRLMTRRPETERSDVIQVEHLDGTRVDGVNLIEVGRVIELLGQLATGDRSVIVVSPFRAQIDHIENTLLSSDHRHLISDLDLRVGTVHGVQGAEADVVIITTALGGAEGKRALSFLEDPNLFNVMVTRARYEQYLLVSASQDELGDGLLASYIRHAEHPPEPSFEVGQLPDWVKELAQKVRAYNLDVLPAYRVAGWTVDLVVTDGSSSVAVECSIHPDGPDAHLERHRALRRAGWTIVDAHQSSWLAAPDEAAQRVAEAVLRGG